MVTADDVRGVGLALPRTYEFFTGGRYKLKVKQIVYAAFSKDETKMGFGYPKDARDGLIESDPETFFLPPPRDLRYQWVCAHLDRLEADEMRELVVDAWRMCTPKMLHDLPELPAPAAAAWNAMDSGEWSDLTALLHPSLQFADGDVALRGRRNVLAHLRAHPTPKPPVSVEVRDGQVYRWSR
ncbi:MmcQ/YjbR family DNA-binding protein [Nocardioides sp. SR21]|uniref:MmcQ/YjbR family DNA-binding protein n=1 Tax=Nocardioides sp. SR21 TaxID=2919501 RepID=UPI001FA953BC|nr:MmcQ/YjbR family DNA-binding protein [Nocardioides sp. SR21]